MILAWRVVHAFLDVSRGNFWLLLVKCFTVRPALELIMISLLPIVLAVLFAALVVAGMLLAPYLLAPRRNTPVKQMPYESGMDPIGDARGRFDVQFYLVAIVFLLFDVELLFLYPWAVAAWGESGLTSTEASSSGIGTGFVLFEVLLFVALLGLAYVYAWRKGVFDWK